MHVLIEREYPDIHDVQIEVLISQTPQLEILHKTQFPLENVVPDTQVKQCALFEHIKQLMILQFKH